MQKYNQDELIYNTGDIEAEGDIKSFLLIVL